MEFFSPTEQARRYSLDSDYKMDRHRHRPYFLLLPRPGSPFLSLSGTLYFRILFGNLSSTPPVVSEYGRSAWDMSATSPAFPLSGRSKAKIEHRSEQAYKHIIRCA